MYNNGLAYNCLAYSSLIVTYFFYLFIFLFMFSHMWRNTCGFGLGDFFSTGLLLRNSINSQIHFMHTFTLVIKCHLINFNTVVPPA